MFLYKRWIRFTLIAFISLFITFPYLDGLILINRKRGSEDQSSDQLQDKYNEEKQAKDSLQETLGKLKDLENNDVTNRIDNGLPVRPKEFKQAKEIEEKYPEFFDVDSGNSDNKKEGYSELKEYLQEELNALSGTKETSVVVESKDRETKKSKSSSESSEVKEKPSPSESSEVKGKGSLIDDFANPNNEFGD
jgi:hypothetical protein